MKTLGIDSLLIAYATPRQVGHQIGQRIRLQHDRDLLRRVGGERGRDHVDELGLVQRLAVLVDEQLAARSLGGAVAIGQVVDDEHRHDRPAAPGFLLERVVQRRSGQLGGLQRFQPHRGRVTRDLLQARGVFGRRRGHARDHLRELRIDVEARALERVDGRRRGRGRRRDRLRLQR
jgi:hypothetical protein